MFCFGELCYPNEDVELANVAVLSRNNCMEYIFTADAACDGSFGLKCETEKH